MSRQQNLIKQLNGESSNWVTGLVMMNIPTIMLENEFIRGICTAANSALLQCLENNEYVLTTFNISANK